MTVDANRAAARVSIEAALKALDEHRDFDVLEFLGNAAETVGTIVVHRMPSIERSKAGRG